MLTNNELAKLYICRRCLNDNSKLKYNSYEIRYKYYNYHFKCSLCGEMHHIVKNIRPMYKWKLFFSQKPDMGKETEDPEIMKAMKRRQKKLKIKKWLNL